MCAQLLAVAVRAATLKVTSAGSTLVGSSRSVSNRRLSRSAAVLSRLARMQRSAAEIPRSCATRASSDASQPASSLTAALFAQKAFPTSVHRRMSLTTGLDRGLASILHRATSCKNIVKICASCIDLNQIAARDLWSIVDCREPRPDLTPAPHDPMDAGSLRGAKGNVSLLCRTVAACPGRSAA